MSPALQQAYRQFMACLPIVCCVLLMLLFATPLRIPGFSQFAPMIAVITVFYWSIFHPRLMPYLAVFGISILQDALNGFPIGISGISLILLRYVVIARFRFFARLSFIKIWMAFWATFSVYYLLHWLLMALYHNFFPLTPAVYLQYATTLLLYPACHWLFNGIFQRADAALSRS